MTLTTELVDWLGDLARWTAAHRALACPCADHEAEHADLMSRKRGLLARCLNAQQPPAEARG